MTTAVGFAAHLLAGHVPRRVVRPVRGRWLVVVRAALRVRRVAVLALPIPRLAVLVLAVGRLLRCLLRRRLGPRPGSRKGVAGWADDRRPEEGAEQATQHAPAGAGRPQRFRDSVEAISIHARALLTMDRRAHAPRPVEPFTVPLWAGHVRCASIESYISRSAAESPTYDLSRRRGSPRTIGIRSRWVCR